MTPVDRDIIIRKLAVIIGSLKALEAIRTMSGEQFAQDLYMRKATERLLQELIEAAIDINTHLIVGSGNAAPDDYYDSFILAGRYSLIPAELAGELAPSAGLRNRLVHEYDVLDQSLVLESAKKALSLYVRYVEAVERYLG
jgi:uncharacterized protein YutE (UPF0331/DUF86 family)